MSGKILVVLAVVVLLPQCRILAAGGDAEKQLRSKIDDLQRENAKLVAELHVQNAALSRSEKVNSEMKQRLEKKTAAEMKKKKSRLSPAEATAEAAAAMGDAILYKELGQGYLKEKQFEQAINAFEKAFSLDANDAAVCYDLGLLYKHQRNDNKKAVTYLKRYLALAPLARDAEDVKYLIRMLEYSGQSYP